MITIELWRVMSIQLTIFIPLKKKNSHSMHSKYQKLYQTRREKLNII